MVAEDVYESCSVPLVTRDVKAPEEVDIFEVVD